MTIERRELDIAGLKAHFYAPKAGGKSPTVIAVHGGGWRLENLDLYRYLGPWLAERGYAVLAVTYRLATPERKVYPEAVDDVRAALRFARSEAKLGIDATVPYADKARFARCRFESVTIDPTALSADVQAIRARLDL